MTYDPKHRALIEAKVIEGIHMGMSKTAAADYAGVDYKTLWRWREESESFNRAMNEAKANFLKGILPKAIEKEPFKMVQALYPDDYRVIDQATQINIDNRPLMAAPSGDLLKLLNLEPAKQIEADDKPDGPRDHQE